MFIKKLLLLSNILLAIASVLSYLSPQIDPEQFWILSFFGLSFPLLLIGNLIFILIWLFIELKYVFISLLTLACGWVFIKGFFAFNSERLNAGPKDFSVVSFNISNALSAYDKVADARKVKTKNMEGFFNRFKDEDILCFQEVGPFASELLKKSFHGWNMHYLKKGSIILTRHKIIKSGQIDFGTITNSCLWADIVVNFDTIRVYSFHLQSNKISRDADEMIENGHLNDKKTWLGIKSMLSKYKQFHIKRSAQAKLIKTHLNISPYPVILGGDLNDTPLSFTYGHLSRGLSDAFYEKGTGIGTTYSGKIPFLRIDYLFSSPDIKAKKFQVLKENFSDHYPVAALFSLEN